MEKTKISAKVIADSVNEFGNRITSFEVIMPRIILAEFNTHRMFSRNSASSRAIPFAKMVEMVEKDPFIPIAWQKDHKGMQGTEYITNKEMIVDVRGCWLNAKQVAVARAKDLSFLKATKQLCNRLLEPFMWHKVIVTATEWENFFALRCPAYELGAANKSYRSRKDYLKAIDELFPDLKDREISEQDWRTINKGQAEIHMMALAEAMWDAYNESTPKKLKAGEWHVPYGGDIDYEIIAELVCEDYGNDFASDETGSIELSNAVEMYKVKVATARCARVSYTVVGEDGKESSYEDDIKLHDRLLKSGHMSPFEHCAKAMDTFEYCNSSHSKAFSSTRENKSSIDSGWSGNFKGFIQYRKMLPNESIFKG